MAIALCLCQLTTRANDIEPGKEFYNATRLTKPVVADGNLADWAGVPVLSDPKFAIPKGSGAKGNFVLFEPYSGGTWSGPDDQTSAVQVAWDADNVYFGFVVTDDYHENAANSAWNGDSVQLMIASSDRTVQVALYNYALGGVEGAIGDVIVNHEAGPGAADPAAETSGVVTRNATTKKTIYEIKLPAAALGMTAPLKAGTTFGLGMAINDGDEAAGQTGQKGWGGLGAHSIVFGKTPSETALVTLSTNTPGSDRLFFSAINPGISSFTFRATDKGSSIVSAASATLTIDGRVVTMTNKKTADATDFTYTAAGPFAPGSDHTYAISVKDTTGNTVTDTGTFKTPAYLPATVAVQPDSSKPGFLVRTWQSTGQPGSLAWTEGQLKGLQGANTADVSTMTDRQFGNSYFDEVGTINYWDTGGEGNFPNDGVQNVPGVATGDNFSLEIIAFLELPAGSTTMGVNSDDGFRVYGAASTSPIDAFAPVLGEFDGGRGVADTTFTVLTEKAGVYPFRMIYFEGGGDAAVELFTIKEDGTRVLVNDTANGGIKAYRGKIGGIDPGFKSISPDPVPRQMAAVSASLSVVLTDGDTKRVDEKSIVLKVDGATVTPTTVRSGSDVTLTYTPAGVQFQQDKHTADLTFKDTTGTYTRNQTWTFYNLKNIVLPAPKILETFDTYPEDSTPTGWVATNFTSRLTDGRNIEDATSESYENWVLVKTEHISAIDGARPFNIAPGLLYNGKEIKNADPVGGTFPDWLMSGNVLYAESDSRGSTDSLDRGYVGQTQFIVSKPFDCSQINDVVLTFSSIYEQNQDSLGAVEYSVDGGRTWLPVVYFLEGPDIKLSGDGTVDALRTFNDANADTSTWMEGTVAKGGKYGDGLAAAITQALSPFVTPRVNDGQIEGKRIEMFRLPQASKKSDVRLRFAQLGTDSWYFAVDNIAFYDVPTALSTSGNLTDGLVAYWNFDGNLYDSIQSLHGTARGKVPVAFVDGQAGFGKALQLNGTNFVEITGSASTLRFASNSLSIAGWFKVGAFDKSWQALISKGENLNYRIARRDAGNNIAYAGGVGEGANDVPAITNGWHHFVAVTDAKGTQFGTALYIDGVIRGLNTNKAVLAAGNANLFIGENPEALNRQWNGQIDDLGLWNRVLTADEVTALYKGGVGTAISTLPGVNAPIGTSISRAGNQLTIQWSPAGGTLEFKNSLDPSAPWTAVGTANPATINIGSGGGFYRVKK